MTWLGEWLKEIVFVVLLAIFVELLLPSKSMQRYVKLVLSLLVLLTLLNPILEMLNNNPLQKLQDTIEAQFRPKAASQSLQQILEEGEKLRYSQQQDTQTWAAAEVASQMKQQLSAGSGLQIDRVAVTLKVTREKAEAGTQKQEYDQPSITSVQVYLKNTVESGSNQAVMAGSGGTDSGKRKQPQIEVKVPAVEQVQIRIDSSDDEKTADSEAYGEEAPQSLPGTQLPNAEEDKQAALAGSPEAAAVAAPVTEETKQAAAMLSGSWGIDPDIIRFFRNEEQTQGTKQ